MKRGFDTNFHSVYKNSPELYHLFSMAEVFSPELIKRLEKLFVGDTLLDVACGTCHKTDKFSTHFSKVYALDVSDTLLNYGRKMYGKNTKLNFILSSAAHIPLLDKSIDTIFISWGSFPLTKTLREVKRILKPGGVVLRIGASGEDDFTKLFPDFDLKRIKRIQYQFEMNGFRQERHTVRIQFRDIKSAKKILSKIIKVNPEKIVSKDLQHNIVLHYYINT